MDTVHEVAIYIHRFHNLDLFQQGWYQLKINMRWEDSSREPQPTPARVVQYEAPGFNSDSEDTMGVWQIDDDDHSFFTQPFHVKYNRQDIYLSVMVSFNLVVGEDEVPASSSIILKFDLIYEPSLMAGVNAEGSSDPSPAAVHEFMIPYKALLGLHSYCPVYFDVFHAVLVDLTVHIVLLKASTPTSSLKWIDNQWSNSKAIDIVKPLLVSHGILLDELNTCSIAIGQAVSELSDTDFDLSKHELIGPLRMELQTSSKGGGMNMGVGKLAGILHTFLEKGDETIHFGNDVLLYTLPKEEIWNIFFTVAGQLSVLWNAFLNFHRINRIKILEYLRDAWAANRKVEWSIWTVHSKTNIPLHYLKSPGADLPLLRMSLGKSALPRKSSENPVQLAAARAELHRKSIAQMKINSHFIQDMQIYGCPSSLPVVFIENNVMNIPRGQPGSTALSMQSLDQNVSKYGADKKSGRILRAVIFVHGFQGHHLDLRLVRNQWLLLDPGADCLMSEANEDRTSDNFREMGRRLANEVIAFLKRKTEKLSRCGGCKDIKLSFVGHSIGNIIIRSALADSSLKPFLKHLYSYMSISGPHLGYWYSSNSLFNSGLWLLKKFKKAQCIHQLTFSDDQDLRNTFFFKLCKEKTLDNFKNIILFSSPQDGYVPYHSARIELCQASSGDNSKKAPVFMEMLNNCLDQIRAPSSEQRTFIRCDVNFDSSLQGTNINSMIGRAAHIEFLETDMYAKFVMWSFPEMFR